MSNEPEVLVNTELQQEDTIESLTDILNKTWALMYPEAPTSWEYPGQVFNHFRVFIGEKKVAIANLTARLALYEKYIRTHLDPDSKLWSVNFEPNGEREDFSGQVYLGGYRTEEEALRAMIQQAAYLLLEAWQKNGFFQQTDASEPIANDLLCTCNASFLNENFGNHEIDCPQNTGE